MKRLIPVLLAATLSLSAQETRREVVHASPNPGTMRGRTAITCRRCMRSTRDKAFGGHLEPGTNVFTFAVITLGVLDDTVDLSRVDDWNNR